MEERVGSGREEMGDGGVGNGRERGRGAGGEKDQDADLKADSKSQEGLVGELDEDYDSGQVDEHSLEPEKGTTLFDSSDGNVDGEESDSILELEISSVKSQEGCRGFNFRFDKGNICWGESYSISEDRQSQHCESEEGCGFDFRSEEWGKPDSLSEDCKSKDCDDTSQERYRGFVERCFTQYNHH